MANCFNCQAATDNPRFCSRSCAVVYNNKNSPKRKRRRKCAGCERLVLSKRQFCEDCFANRPRLWKDKQEANRFYVKQARKRLKLKAVDYKGGACKACGYSKCISALEFHHIDPAQKDFQLSEAARDTWSWEKIQTELDKCVLLCCRCHREIHAGIIRMESLDKSNKRDTILD